MAAKDKVRFEPHAGYTVGTQMPDGKTLNLGEGFRDAYETSDPVEIALLENTAFVKRVGPAGSGPKVTNERTPGRERDLASEGKS